jgi:hypothetical protein
MTQVYPQIGIDYPNTNLDAQAVNGFLLRCDDDGDGIVTIQEFVDMINNDIIPTLNSITGQGGYLNHPATTEMFTQFDLDGNGIFDQAEIQASLEHYFDSFVKWYVENPPNINADKARELIHHLEEKFIQAYQEMGASPYLPSPPTPVPLSFFTLSMCLCLCLFLFLIFFFFFLLLLLLLQYLP